MVNSSDDRQPTVLVIDDELGPRESLRYLLKDTHRVLCADSVDRGLDLLREHAPDTVILDLRMPGRNGIEGLGEIRRLDPDVAVIILTGFGALDTAREAVRHEASDYMEKPFDAVEMRRTVERHVARTRVRRQRAQMAHEVGRLHERLAAELRDRERLVELGQVSAEFVHDLRNAFAVVSGSAELLRQELVQQPDERASDHPEDVRSYLGAMDRTVRLCTELLDTWQRLIRQDPGREEPVDMAAVGREVTDACQALASSAHARLECECPSAVTVTGDPVQLARALTNVVHNAVQALPESGGVVRLSVERADGCACVRVTDNGCGIPSEYHERIFTPNFTTRRTHGGMGLGLFIVRKIVESHGGAVTVDSAVGRGTTLAISLPLVRRPAVATASSPAPAVPRFEPQFAL
jgi:signal transduction histidine kinase